MQYAVSELRGLLDTMELIEELIHAYEGLEKNQLSYLENEISKLNENLSIF